MKTLFILILCVFAHLGREVFKYDLVLKNKDDRLNKRRQEFMENRCQLFWDITTTKCKENSEEEKHQITLRIMFCHYYSQKAADLCDKDLERCILSLKPNEHNTYTQIRRNFKVECDYFRRLQLNQMVFQKIYFDRRCVEFLEFYSFIFDKLVAPLKSIIESATFEPTIKEIIRELSVFILIVSIIGFLLNKCVKCILNVILKIIQKFEKRPKRPLLHLNRPQCVRVRQHYQNLRYM